MTPSHRLFVAVQLPDDWHRMLADLQQRQERRTPGYFRWVPPELFHLTVAFLGNQSDVDAIAAALRSAAAGISPLRLELERLGTFGPPRAPRVLFAAVDQPDRRLQQLRARLDDELRSIGVEYDRRPLRPHITLGRARRDARIPVGIVDAVLKSRPYTASEVVLMESYLSASAPRYEVLATVPLGSNNV